MLGLGDVLTSANALARWGVHGRMRGLPAGVLAWRRCHSGDRETRAWLSCAAPDKSFQVTEYVAQPDGVMVSSGACEQIATKRPEDRFRSKPNQTNN